MSDTDKILPAKSWRRLYIVEWISITSLGFQATALKYPICPRLLRGRQKRFHCPQMIFNEWVDPVMIPGPEGSLVADSEFIRTTYTRRRDGRRLAGESNAPDRPPG